MIFDYIIMSVKTYIEYLKKNIKKEILWYYQIFDWNYFIQHLAAITRVFFSIYLDSYLSLVK